MKSITILIFSLFLTLVGCTRQNNENEVWIYTSLYKDTIADIEPKLAKAFPDLDIRFYQAGSEEIAAKVNAEILAGGTNADILISSDRFWYEEMANSGMLHVYQNEQTQKIPADLKHAEGLYTTLSIPVMVLAYNTEALSDGSAPSTFKEMVSDKWKGKFSTGSPLSSGTNFTTVAFLSKAYGWDYFKKLQANGTISEGGNSAVIRRIQNQERPVGWVLLENILRYQDQKTSIKTVFPTDGVVLHNNVLAVTKKKKSRENAVKVANWLFGNEGQAAMTRSFMYSPFPDFQVPKGAPSFAQIHKNSFQWTDEFVREVVKNRSQIKEKFAEIMFN